MVDHMNDTLPIVEELASKREAANTRIAELETQAVTYKRAEKKSRLKMRSDEQTAALVLDISERKQMDIAGHKQDEDARHAGEEEYQLLFDNMLDGCTYCKMIFEDDRPVDLVYLKVNSAFVKLTGLSDIIGKRVTEAVPGLTETNPELLETYGKVVKTGQPARFVIHVEQLSAWFTVSAYSVGNDAFIATFDNITERKQGEAALLESEERYRQLFESMASGFVLFDVVCDESGMPQDLRYLAVNAAFERMTGLMSEQIGGKLFSHIMPERSHRWIDILGRIALGDKSLHDESWSESWNKYFEVRAFSPKPGQVAVLLQDNTERKHAEKEKEWMQLQLVQAQKMESIGRLAGGIAHDFNNMLGVISGNISYALYHMENNDVLYEVLSDVQKSSKQAQKLTHQLLTFSKGGAPIKKVLNVNELINQSAIFSTRGAKANCHFELSDNLWFSNVDEGQINQAIGNLIINANQAMPNGGTITIRTQNTEIKADSGMPLSAGRYIKIVVEDQGTGICQKHLPHIFEPYYSTKQDGNGLGLATTYSILKKHGGHVTIYSEIDKGTVVTLYLPASSENIIENKVAKEHKHAGHGKILIMDDHESILNMVCRILTKMGYEATSATDGTQAIDIYREAYSNQNPFDLVILDLTVPGGMGGARTIQELLKIDPKVKAVVSSGYSNDPIMANHEDYGFCGVVPKPYTSGQLAEVLNTILGDTLQDASSR